MASPLTATPQWQALTAHRQVFDRFDLRDAFAADPERAARFTRTVRLDAAEVVLDFSKNLLDTATLDLLLALADARGLRARIDAMFAGERINTTEGRAVLHVALRDHSPAPLLLDGRDVKRDVAAVRTRFLDCAERVRSGAWRGYTGEPITDVVNIGIGGSDLGPQMMVEALRPYHDGPRVHFVSNVDAAHLTMTLKTLEPAGTLFIVASKTFTTLETMLNARLARAWLVDALGHDAAVARHFVAVSTNTRAVTEFGIQPDNMFEFWDWVGGRYSLWSSVGLSIALATGRARFEQMLAGAHALDHHFRTAPFADNLPVLLGLIGLWYVDFWGAQSHAILPYYQPLSRFVAHIQQLDMESNGKSVTLAGDAVDYATAPVIWGEPGTNAQHAFMQRLHQGPGFVPIDFIVAAAADHAHAESHRALVANCFAQAQALMVGRTRDQVAAQARAAGKSPQEAARLGLHREMPGNRPSNTLLVRRFDPFTLGLLTALYEHKVFVQGAVWGINSFDQWGVELGKELATQLDRALASDRNEGLDASTAALIGHWRRLQAE